MEIEEIVKMLVFVVFLVVMVGAVVFLFQGKGGELLASIKNILRFG
jgi:hypothetical protein